MNYQTYPPHPDLASLVKFYWTLEVPFDPQHPKQKIVPDGCIEMTFNLGDKIRRYISEDAYILHPNAMVMGQRTKSYDILPEGDVDTIAICFYPHGFANFVHTPLEVLVDKETPMAALFGQAVADKLERQIAQAIDIPQRIQLIETFLLNKLKETSTISHIVQSTVDMLLQSNGSTPINALVQDDTAKRRQLERHFRNQIGISPKQLSKVIRLQATLHMLLNKEATSLTDIAYEHAYFDQNHFIKDFKEFVGVTPKAYLGNAHMALSALFYK
jgi:AraC-like DNA-binding protein